MKNKIITLSLILCAGYTNAQTISVGEQTATFSIGTQNALTSTIYNCTKEDAVNKWKSYLKEFKNEKVKFDKDEMFGDNILIKEWGNNPVDVYTKFEENTDAKTVKIMVAYNLGGAFLSSSTDAVKYESAQKMVKDFAVKTSKFPLEEKLRAAQKLLEKISDEQKDLESKNKSLLNDIESYGNKIAKAQDDITANENEQQKKKTEIETQKSVLEKIKTQVDGVN